MKRLPQLVFFIIAFEGIGAGLGMLTAPQIDGWYADLIKSPVNPPGFAFGVVWPILYLMLAVSIWMIMKKEKSVERTRIFCLFGAHMILNWAWTPVFFTLHSLSGGLVILGLIIATAIMLFAMMWKIGRYAALLLAPYLAWVCFAFHLNHYIWQNNS